MEGKIKIGPVGKGGVSNMGIWDEGSHNNILSQIFLSHDSDGIWSIQFQFMLDDEKFILSDRYGRKSTGNKFDVIALDWPHEYITGISGEYSCTESVGIRSLKFATNFNEYGPFGSSTSKNETKFDFSLGKLSQFGGFFGKAAGNGLQNIGVYLQPSTARPKTKPKTKPKTSTSNADETNSTIVLG